MCGIMIWVGKDLRFRICCSLGLQRENSLSPHVIVCFQTGPRNTGENPLQIPMLSSKEIPPIAATFLVGDQFTPVGLRMG